MDDKQEDRTHPSTKGHGSGYTTTDMKKNNGIIKNY